MVRLSWFLEGRGGDGVRFVGVRFAVCGRKDGIRLADCWRRDGVRFGKFLEERRG